MKRKICFKKSTILLLILLIILLVTANFVMIQTALALFWIASTLLLLLLIAFLDSRNLPSIRWLIKTLLIISDCSPSHSSKTGYDWQASDLCWCQQTTPIHHPNEVPARYSKEPKRNRLDHSQHAIRRSFELFRETFLGVQ